MKEIYTVKLDVYDPDLLIYCLKEMDGEVKDFEYEWSIRANAGGIDYGLFLNINITDKEVVICNQPENDTHTDIHTVIEKIQGVCDDEQD